MKRIAPDVWLARTFLLLVLGAGCVSLLIGLPPESLSVFPCPFHLVTGLQCPGCGMTRACIALACGDLGGALHYNPFSLGLVLFAGAFALFPNRMRSGWRNLSVRTRTAGSWLLLVLVLGVWIRLAFL